MRNQHLVDSITIDGNYSRNPDAIASLVVKNNPELQELSEETLVYGAEHIATFLLETVPFAVLEEVVDRIQFKVQTLDDLGDAFDQEAFERLANGVDPEVNRLFAIKQTNWDNGVASTEQMYLFITDAIGYLNGQ